VNFRDGEAGIEAGMKIEVFSDDMPHPKIIRFREAQ
jgi:hypothetical protein